MKTRGAGDFLFVAILLAAWLIIVSVTAQAAAPSFATTRTCSQLFQVIGGNRIPDLSAMGEILRGPEVREKFADADASKIFYRIIDQDFSHETRVWLDTYPLKVRDGGQATENFFQGLIDAGLGFQPVPGDRNASQLYLEGPIDLLLPALRHPAIRVIGPTRDVRGVRSWPFFSQVHPVSTEPTFEYTQQKFPSLQFYQRFRHDLLNGPGETYEMALRVSLLENANGGVDAADTAFLGDIKKLGLIAHSKLSERRRILTVEGPIDALHMVVRHPAIQEVLRFHATKSLEKLREEREAEALEKAKVRRDLTARYSPSKVAISGEEPLLHKIVSYRDPETPSLIHVGGAPQDRVTIEHELQTARDYAVFLDAQYGQEFGYAFEIDGKQVPLFDGVILQKRTHFPLANISLKYATEPVESGSLQLIQKVLSERVAKHREKATILLDADQWFRGANAYFGSIDKLKDGYGYSRRLEHARILMNLFGLSFEQNAKRRETRIVIDYRQFPFLFDLFRKEWVQDFVVKMLREAATPDISLTLLWNAHQVIEIRHQGLKIYE